MRKLLVLFLTAVLLLNCFSAAGETISPIPAITDFENRMQEVMYDFSSEQREVLAASIELNGSSYWEEWFPDMPLSLLLSQLRDSMPESTIFFTCPNITRLTHKEQLTADNLDVLRGRILSASLYSTCTLNTFTSAVIDGLSVYSIWDETAFRGAAYLVSFYGDELPCVVTAFVEDGNGRSITKTSLIYTEGAMDGNEFWLISQYIVSQWGWDGEIFDIRILNHNTDDIGA